MIAEGAADNFYLTDADYNGFPFDRERNIYLWRNTAVDGDAGHWQRQYNSILSCNVVLETIAANEYPNEIALANSLKGRALFHRASCLFNLLQLFAKAYHPNTANTDLGIPLRLSSDFEQESKRNSIDACYAQIIADLKIANALLEEKGFIATRPDKINSYGLLSKVTLFKGDYEMSKLYADSSLRLYSQLIDYNGLNKSSNTPFSRFNAETIFYATGSFTVLSPTRSKINPDLYQSYAVNDLRKDLFFRRNTDGTTYQFKGNYTGVNGTTLFTGLTTAEILLNRAEALARTNQLALAMDDLNMLLLKRYQTGTYVAKTANNEAEALDLILLERRKELIFRGVRWYDLKRLNLDANWAVTLNKSVLGQNYTLLPNANRYVFPIPQEVIERGGLVQNE
ncbi:RagB/SusD family nutrient uptake outer membrane protein [Pedobacter alpinus]|uniref:RagB/SusD family nutrient uptake outer membrane protein n=1 Tax=Pedobacter alpinus TaxID=1590643 RepID=A0ABW5TTL3_9SPHI